METKPTSHIVQGVVITLILIILGLIIYFTGQINNKALASVQYLILIGGIVWSCLQYSKQLDHHVTFGNIFAHGFKTTAVIIALMAVYTFLSLKLIFPEMGDKILEEARKNMEAQNKMSDAQMDQAIDMTKRFFVPFAIGGIIIMFAIVGAIASLIGAAVAKKNPPNPFIQQG